MIHPLTAPASLLDPSLPRSYLVQSVWGSVLRGLQARRKTVPPATAVWGSVLLGLQARRKTVPPATAATGAATGTVTTPTPNSSDHSHQPLIDLVASLVTTYVCVTKDMGLGVGLGVAVSRSGGLVRFVGDKIGRVGKPLEWQKAAGQQG